MSIFRKKMSTIYMKMQGLKGVAETVSDSDAILWLDDTGFLQPQTEIVDRGIGPTGSWPSSVYAVGRWGEGSLPVELRGSGVAGTPPEYSPALETLLGTKYITVADTVEAGSGAVGGFDASEEFQVGTLVRVKIGTGYEVRRIATKSGTGPYSYTVQRSFSLAPADGAEICAGVTYLHLGTEDEQYFTLDQYLCNKRGGNGFRLLGTDTVAESVNISIGAREIIRAVFGLRSLSCDETGSTTDPNTPDYNTTSPLGGVSCNLIRAGAAYDVKSLAINIKTRRARGGINSAGYNELPWAGQFEAGITATPWVEDETPFTDFFSATSVNAELTKGTTAGNILHIEAAGLERRGPQIGEDEGDLTWADELTITKGFYVGLF